MNIKHLSLALIAAASATVAMADTGTITFNGLVVANTCTTALTGGATAVTLPTVLTSALTTAGNTAGDTAFSLNVTGCDATAATRGIHYTLTPSAYDATNNSLIVNTGSATNVGVEILEGATPIAFAGAPHQTANVTLDGAGAGSVSLAAQYKATGAATAGTVTSALNWTLVYN